MGKGDWKEVGEQQFRFTKAGDALEGKLIAREATTLDVQLYHIIPKGEEQTVAVLGSIGLDELMADIENGVEVRIELSEIVATKSGNRFKNYRVFSKGS